MNRCRSLCVLNLRSSDRPGQPARSYSELLRQWSPACEEFLAKRGRLAYVLIVRVLVTYNLLYLAACGGVVIDYSSMQSFTDSILLFWRRNGHKFPSKWAEAARIMFAMTPNSASAERVFSLLKAMFDDSRSLALSDLVEGSLMLKYNKAKRAAEKEAAL